MSLLNKAKTLLRTASSDMLSDYSKEEDFSATDFDNMYRMHGYMMFTVAKITTLSDLFKRLLNDEFSALGYDAEDMEGFIEDLTSDTREVIKLEFIIGHLNMN